jgi:hypothetical protein
MFEKKTKMPICNCNYNTINHLAKTLKFLSRVDVFIKDAKKDGHKDCVAMWERFKQQALQNSEDMRMMVEMCSKEGKFC